MLSKVLFIYSNGELLINSIKIDVHYFNAQPYTNITFNWFNYPQFMSVSTSSYMAISKKICSE